MAKPAGLVSQFSFNESPGRTGEKKKKRGEVETAFDHLFDEKKPLEGEKKKKGEGEGTYPRWSPPCLPRNGKEGKG